MSSTRPASRALGLTLVHQEYGVRYYRQKRVSGDETVILMASTSGRAIDVCIHTAHFLGSGRAGTAPGSQPGASPESDTSTLSGHRLVLLLCESEHAISPSVGIRVRGSILDRPYYPDVLATSDLAELTIESPEASGFAAAVSRLCAPHEVLIGIVPQSETAAGRRGAVSDFAALAESTLKKFPATFEFECRERDAIRACCRRLRLSTAESKQLEKAARAARIRGATSAEIIHHISEASHARPLITTLEQAHAE
ncbi:MAG: hypothetical protein ACLFM0_01520 [Spirochaetales bacterium]